MAADPDGAEAPQLGRKYWPEATPAEKASSSPSHPAAERWLQKREATAAQASARQQRREECLRCSTQYGVAVGCVGTAAGAQLVFRTLKARNPAFGAFWIFVSFFMPFQVVSNVTRNRCQKAGQLQDRSPPRGEAAPSGGVAA